MSAYEFYEFVEREKANHAVVRLCQVLSVSPSGYWAWQNRRRRTSSARAQADAQLTAQIRAIHQASRQTDGAPRIHAALATSGTHCGRKRVARLMRHAGLTGCHRRRPFRTTQRDPQAEPAPDLVQRQFVATEPNALWIADITFVPTLTEGFLYVAVILDVFSRRVVGWAMAAHLRTELVVGALEMAVWNRQPGEGVIHHSDHGCQYTALLFGEHCQGRTLSGGRYPLFHGVGRRLLRQRHGGELLRHPGVRTPGPSALPDPTRGPYRAVRVPRSFLQFLQSPAAAFGAGLSLPN